VFFFLAMTPLQDKLLNAFLAAHHGVISRQDARSLGLTEEQVKWSLRCGRWERLHRGVYHRSGEAAGPEARLLAACMAAGRGAVASHTSAAWLWQLIGQAPTVPTVTVARDRSDRLAGVERHRRSDIDRSRVLVRHGIPVTDPLRTLADLGEVVDVPALDDAIDRALSRKLITVQGLDDEVRRLTRRGRRGVPQLRSALERRGFGAAPHPSVLESRTMRLLQRWGVTPIGTEVVVCDGKYRLDVALRAGVALEVDGYATTGRPRPRRPTAAGATICAWPGSSSSRPTGPRSHAAPRSCGPRSKRPWSW